MTRALLRTFFTISLLLSASYFGIAFASQQCEGSTMEMLDCGTAIYKQVDQKLNTTYKALLQKLDGISKQKLIKTETAWIKFRDLNCDVRAEAYKGGSIQPLIYQGCLIDMTEQRLKDLESQLNPEG